MLEPWDLAELCKCAFCPDLSKDHVPGVGPLNAQLMIVGQSPGNTEVKEKRPFCGPSGKLVEGLLTELLLHRDEVYITNVVKCHPPGNRASSHTEIDVCVRHHLYREIHEVDPAVMLLLGKDAHQAICKDYIFRTYTCVRSERRSYVSTYHPSFWLRRGYSGGPEFLKVAPILQKELEFWKDVRHEVDHTPQPRPKQLPGSTKADS